MNARLVAIAAGLQHPVTQLSAVVISAASGGQDSHGQDTTSDERARDILLNRLTAARAAIETAILALASKERTDRV